MMRSLIFIIAILFSCIGVYAETYQVNAKSGLNIRNATDASAQVVGKLENGDIIEVESIIGEWAEIEYNGKMAYVSCNYIQSYSGQSSSTSSDKNECGAFLPIFIFVLSFVAAWLWGHEYYWYAVASTLLLLIVCWYMLACTHLPLWFLTERGVGFGMMLVNMFLTFLCIALIWNCIMVTMMSLCVDKVSAWGIKVLFVLNVFSSGNFFLALLVMWGVGVAIYRSIKKSEFVSLFLSIAGLALGAVVVYFGGALCEEVFHGFDAFILVVATFPQLLKCAEAFDGSRSDDELEHYSLLEEGGHVINLTQTSRYSSCNFTDQDGNRWTKDSQGFHRY